MTVFSKPQDSPGHALTQTHGILLAKSRTSYPHDEIPISEPHGGGVYSLHLWNSIHSNVAKKTTFFPLLLVNRFEEPDHKINVPIMVPIMSPLSLRSA